MCVDDKSVDCQNNSTNDTENVCFEKMSEEEFVEFFERIYFDYEEAFRRLV